MVHETNQSEGGLKRLFARLDPIKVLTSIGVNPALVREQGNEILAPCPPRVAELAGGGEGGNGFLLIERDSGRVFFKEDDTTPNHGRLIFANLAELYAAGKGIGEDEAIQELAEQAGVDLEDDQQERPPGYGFLRLVRFEFERQEDGSLIRRRVPVKYHDREHPHGVLVRPEEIPEVLKENYNDLYQSRYSYLTQEVERLDQLIEEGQVDLYGDFQVVFEAHNSSEMVHAINQALEVIDRLDKGYDIPPDAISIYYSGRLLEVVVDATVFGIEPQPDLHRVFRRMAEIVLGYEPEEEEAFRQQWSQLSWQVYDPTSLTPVLGSALSTPKGAHKIRLPVSVFKRTNYVTLYELSKRPGKYTPRDPYPQKLPLAEELYQNARGQARLAGGVITFDRLTQLFYRVEEGEEVSLRNLHALAPELLRRFFSHERRLIRTPSNDLNRLLGGGLTPGKVYVIGGFPGAGVSTFVNWLMLEAARTGQAVSLFITMQRGIEELYLKSLAAVGSLPSELIDRARAEPDLLMEDDQFNQQIQQAYEKFQEFNSAIAMVEGTWATDFEALRKQTERLRAVAAELEEKTTPLIIIDTLPMFISGLNASLPEGSRLDTHLALSQLKSMAREFDVVVLCTYEIFSPPAGLSAEAREEAIANFFRDTEFADAVGVLRPLGRTTSYLIDHLPAHQVGDLEQARKHLGEIEQNYFGQGGKAEESHTFAALELLKSTGGMTGYALFLHERNYSRFRVVEIGEG